MDKLIGLIPAAGRAKRLGSLQCSKEIFPIGFKTSSENEKELRTPKAAASYLLERMVLSGVNHAFMIINKDKYDIPRYFGNGMSEGLHIAYLVQETPCGMPDALNQAFPFLEDATVVFGMPDTVFYPENAFVQLIENHRMNKADVTLGVFPTDRPQRFGMVCFSEDGKLIYTVDKPEKTDLQYMWGIGCWNWRFTQFMHEHLKISTESQKESVLGDVFQAALVEGLEIRVNAFPAGRYIDIGTLQDLVDLVVSPPVQIPHLDY